MWACSRCLVYPSNTKFADDNEALNYSLIFSNLTNDFIKPLFSFGSNHVDFGGGITSPASATSIRLSIDVG